MCFVICPISVPTVSPSDQGAKLQSSLLRGCASFCLVLPKPALLEAQGYPTCACWTFLCIYKWCGIWFFSVPYEIFGLKRISLHRGRYSGI